MLSLVENDLTNRLSDHVEQIVATGDDSVYLHLRGADSRESISIVRNEYQARVAAVFAED